MISEMLKIELYLNSDLPNYASKNDDYPGKYVGECFELALLFTEV